MKNWLKHAFAIESSDAVAPSASQLQAIDLICQEIVRRNMVLPAQMLLESSAPLHYLGGQMLRFFEPFLGILLAPAATRDFAAFLERPGAVQYICRRFDELRFDELQQAGSGLPINTDMRSNCRSAEAVANSGRCSDQDQFVNRCAISAGSTVPERAKEVGS